MILTGSKQYLVSEGETIDVELLNAKDKKIDLKPLLIISDDKTIVGTPEIDNAVVTVEVIEAEIKADKVTAIRYKAKKRVKKVRGHRQRLTKIKVISIK